MNANQRLRILAQMKQFMRDVSMSEKPVEEEHAQFFVDGRTPSDDEVMIKALYVRNLRLFVMCIPSAHLESSVDDFVLYTRNSPFNLVSYLDEKCFGRDKYVFNADTEQWVKHRALSPDVLAKQAIEEPKQTRHLAADGTVAQGPPGAVDEAEQAMVELMPKVTRVVRKEIDQTYKHSEIELGETEKKLEKLQIEDADADPNDKAPQEANSIPE